MVATGLSMLAWAFPSFGILRKGFEKAAALDPVAVLIVTAWYVLIFLCFRLGEFFGGGSRSGSPLPSRVVSLDADPPYYVFTLIAAVGVLAAAAKVIGSLSLEGTIGFVMSGNANMMKEAIYDDYHIGLLSLRYVAIYPASLALYRLFT